MIISKNLFAQPADSTEMGVRADVAAQEVFATLLRRCLDVGQVARAEHRDKQRALDPHAGLAVEVARFLARVIDDMQSS